MSSLNTLSSMVEVDRALGAMAQIVDMLDKDEVKKTLKGLIFNCQAGLKTVSLGFDELWHTVFELIKEAKY